MSTKAQRKQERLEKANAVIQAISRHGRRFFYYDKTGAVSYFKLDERGRIWLVDKYTQKPVYVAYRYHWHRFTEGGTLRALIEALRDFIRTGEQISSGHFAGYPGWFAPGDPWGYGTEAMEAVRVEVMQTGAVKPQAENVA